MEKKLKLTCLVGTFCAVTALASPSWEANTPGVPAFLPYISGSGFSLTGGPTSAVATNGTIYALAADSSGSYLVSWSYCGGWYEIAAFTGGSGVTTLVLGTDGMLFIGGEFTSLTPVSPVSTDWVTYSVTNIAAFNLNTAGWSGFGYGAGATTNTIVALAVDSNDKVYIGTFPAAGEGGIGYPSVFSYTNAVMVYSNSHWVSLGGNLLNYGAYSSGDPIQAMVAEGTDIYIAGTVLGGTNGSTFVASTNLIKWSGGSQSWQAMNGTTNLWGTVQVNPEFYNPGITALAVSGTNVFVAENGAFPGDSSYSGVTIFSTSGTWLSGEQSSVNLDLGTSPCGPTGVGYSLAMQHGTVYVGGNFTYAGGCSGSDCNSIAEWTNGGWQSLGTGVEYSGGPGTVTSLAADNYAVYVFGQFDTVGGTAYTNTPDYGPQIPSGAMWATATGTPCETNIDFIDVNFAESGSASIAGEAAFGFSADDEWNYFAYAKCGHSAARTNINNMTNIFGHITDASISIAAGADLGPTTDSGAVPPVLKNDIAYDSVINCGEATATVTISNLASIGLNGGPALYNVYVYGFGPGSGYSINGQFTISPSGTNSSGGAVTTLKTSSAVYTVTNWVEGNQYVLFPNVPIGPGTNLTITVTHDPDNSYDGWALNGIQIVPYPY